jgi:hypothetical protein
VGVTAGSREVPGRKPVRGDNNDDDDNNNNNKQNRRETKKRDCQHIVLFNFL